jgi:hypothetical protein
VAYWAHIGGFLAGMALIPFFKKPHVKLFAKPVSRAFQVQGVASHIPQVGATQRKNRPQEHPWQK